MNKPDDPRWRATRAGARAGRGFRFQDAVAASLLVEQWVKGESAKIVPEGLDDINLFVGEVETRIQAKSMHDPKGSFRVSQLAEYLDKSASLLTPEEWHDDSVRLAVILERPIADMQARGWEKPLGSYHDITALRQALLAGHSAASAYTVDQLLERAFLLVENSPLDRAVDRMHGERDLARFACRLAVQQLRSSAGISADENYRRRSSDPSVITTTDVAVAIEGILLATQEGGLERALREGICEIVDFSSQVHESAFYSGVNVVPGHVAAGLVFDRPMILEEIDTALRHVRSVLIAGQSGSGKSASAWLYAHATRHEVIWYRVRNLPDGESHLLLRLAAANEATPGRRIGFVLDDVGRNFVGSWDELVREAAQIEGVVLVGTIREEDLDLIADLRGSAVVRPQLDEELASRLFSQLPPAEPARFLHWREPFEQSKGLLLEFTHLVTQGERLESVLRDQVRQRVVEHRDDELLILQAVSFASRFSASLDKDRLRLATGLAPFTFARAVNRLLEEHAVSLVGTDCIGGLHEIRSRHLDSLVREITHVNEMASLDMSTTSVRLDDLARFVFLVSREIPTLQVSLVNGLRRLLETSPIRAWTAAFHGLGLVTCAQIGNQWVDIWKAQGHDERFASLVFNLLMVDADFEGLDFWEKIRDATRRFAQISVSDLRTCLSEQLENSAPPVEWTLLEAIECAASLMPLHGAVDHPAVPAWLVSKVYDSSVTEILGLVSVLREVSEQYASLAIEAHGGSSLLLTGLHAETAWLTRPSVDEDGGRRVVRANIRVVSDEVQSELHERAVSLCELLIAATPGADVAAVSAVLADGSVLVVGEYTVADVKLERKRIAVAARVAWNRAQLRSVQQVQEVDSQTARANSLAIALEETTEQLRQIAECFCRLHPVPAKLQLMTGIRKVLNGMIRPGRVEASVSGPLDKGSYDTSDTVADLIDGMQEIAKELIAGKPEKPLLSGSRAMKLSLKVREAAHLHLWRYTEMAHSIDFDKTAKLLEEIAYVLVDMHVSSDASYSSRALLSKRSRKHSALQAAAEQSLRRAAALVEIRRQQIEAHFQSAREGCIVVARDEPYEVMWPAASFAILIPCEQAIEFYQVIEAVVSHHPWDGNDMRTAVPLLRGKVAAKFAIGGMSTLLPRFDFDAEWRDELPYTMLDNVATSAFDRVFGDCTVLSAALTGLDRDLNEEEGRFIETVVARLSEALKSFVDLRKSEDDEVITTAASFLAESAQKAMNQVDQNGEGPSLAIEQAPLLRGEINEANWQLLGLKLLLADWDAAASP